MALGLYDIVGGIRGDLEKKRQRENEEATTKANASLLGIQNLLKPKYDEGGRPVGFEESQDIKKPYYKGLRDLGILNSSKPVPGSPAVRETIDSQGNLIPPSQEENPGDKEINAFLKGLPNAGQAPLPQMPQSNFQPAAQKSILEDPTHKHKEMDSLGKIIGITKNDQGKDVTATKQDFEPTTVGYTPPVAPSKEDLPEENIPSMLLKNLVARAGHTPTYQRTQKLGSIPEALLAKAGIGAEYASLHPEQEIPLTAISQLSKQLGPPRLDPNLVRPEIEDYFRTGGKSGLPQNVGALTSAERSLISQTRALGAQDRIAKNEDRNFSQRQKEFDQRTNEIKNPQLQARVAAGRDYQDILGEVANAMQSGKFRPRVALAAAKKYDLTSPITAMAAKTFGGLSDDEFALVQALQRADEKHAGTIGRGVTGYGLKFVQKLGANLNNPEVFRKSIETINDTINKDIVESVDQAKSFKKGDTAKIAAPRPSPFKKEANKDSGPEREALTRMLNSKNASPAQRAKAASIFKGKYGEDL